MLGRAEEARVRGVPIALDLGYREWIDGEPGLEEARLEFEAALRRAVSVDERGTVERPLWVLAGP